MRWLALLGVLLPLPALAQSSGELIRFVSCPIYRDADAGRKSGCWLADDPATGKRWDVSLSPYKPDWNFAVLVEGKVSAAPGDACGSPVLDAVRTSRLYDRPCTRHMLPAEGYPGRRFVLPRRNIDPLSVARKVPDGPFADRTFPVYFEWDNDFLVYQYDDWLIDRAVTWLRAAKPKRIEVVGFADTTPQQVSGVTLAERPEVARERAESIALTLRRLLPGATVTSRWEANSAQIDDAEADGLPWQSRRRAEIHAFL
jgi:hypothetical protein